MCPHMEYSTQTSHMALMVKLLYLFGQSSANENDN
jgi:hypothetical protein